MKYYAILLGLILATSAHAADYLDRALYWCHHNGHTEATKALTEVLNMGTGKGTLSYIVYQAESWKFAGPSKATLDALDEGTVDAWVAGYDAGLKADYDNWEKRLRALTRLFVIEINKLRALHSLPEYTKAQVVNALKGEL